MFQKDFKENNSHYHLFNYHVQTINEKLIQEHLNAFS